jgi:galactokinase
MPPPSPRPDPASKARSTLDALGRLRGRASPPPPQALRRRARELLEARFGPVEQRRTADGFGRGATGLLAEHTHYSDGFAVLAPLAQGAAVAARRAPSPDAPPRLTFEDALGGTDGSEAPIYEGPASPSSSSGDALPRKARAARAVLDAFAPGPVEAAVVSAVPPACFDARLAALGVAAARAGRELDDGPRGADAPDDAIDWEGVRAALADGAGVPFSRAYVMAAAPQAFASQEDTSATPLAETSASSAPPADRAPHWLLADTAAREHLPVEAPPPDELGRGLISAPARDALGGETLVRPAAFHHERRRQAQDALSVLREGGFEDLSSFRDLEHRDLDRALHLLPPRLKFAARHLITQNRRVPRLVRAARQRDQQLLGTLLLMSHLSHEDDWQTTDAPLDAVVAAAEDTDLEGLYGACMTGRGPCVLVVGRPAALPRFFRRATRLLDEQFDRSAETMLL